ncbi:c-type cytochrome [Legionella maioricensis]|uniref:C-type cytochrome n=1 Tax=Legionella maioricensis TaxID=2896528 RepID=A0A9X2D3G6_9GAMM|nr:c-type cytochrome [Legionella maioricensis]MCL9685854.1 c-type cytochrome [Legionella maioricensis]MCL9689275.1 c-type cytochrome [Legionella maioricensis]
MRLNIAVLLAFFSFSLYAIDDPELQKIQQRLQPVGQLHVQEQEGTTAQTSAEDKETTKKANESGQKIYEHHCIVCHRDGLAGAPKLQNEKDWKPRLTGRTLKDLVASSIKGLNAMPIKGTCIECNEKDLEDAIQYMLPKS